MRRNQYMIRKMSELEVGMHITYVGMMRSFDYVIVDVSRKAGCAQVVKQDDAREHPRKMMLKSLPYFIKRGLVWADE